MADTIESPGANADALIQRLIDGYKVQPRSPLLKDPSSQGLDFESLSFPSEDGVPLEAWFIPRAGSDRLIVANHPRYFSRYGFPSHLEPWRSMFANGGNDFEVDFNPDYRILHEAGFNVLTYDLRNLGHSGAANGGISSGGVFEARDVIGSLRFVRSRSDLASMKLSLFSRCLGCNATLFAIARQPDEFASVACIVGVQPLSPRSVIEKILELAEVPSGRIGDVEQGIRRATSLFLDDMSPVQPARKNHLPTFLYQVRDDVLTHQQDVQSVFDAMPAADKKLLWIDGTTRRWDGYTYFQRNPKQVLDWLDNHMATDRSSS